MGPFTCVVKKNCYVDSFAGHLASPTTWLCSSNEQKCGHGGCVNVGCSAFSGDKKGELCAWLWVGSSLNVVNIHGKFHGLTKQRYRG